MESRDNHLWKDNQAKIGQLIDAVTRMREQTKQKQSEAHERLQSFQATVSEQEFKLQHLVKQVEMLLSYSPSGPPSGVALNEN